MVIASRFTDDPISGTSGALTFRKWNITGALTGLPAIGSETLRLSGPVPVAPMDETKPSERVAEAHDRMMGGNARFQFILTIGA